MLSTNQKTKLKNHNEQFFLLLLSIKIKVNYARYEKLLVIKYNGILNNSYCAFDNFKLATATSHIICQNRKGYIRDMLVK